MKIFRLISLIFVLCVSSILCGCGETIECPDFVGKNYDIVTSGDRYDAIEFEAKFVESDKNDGGIILSQNIEPGTKIAKGDTVKLEVSKGLPKTTVPSVVGLSEADAEQKLKDAGFDVVFVYGASTEVEEGKCFATSPKPESQYAIGGTISVHISLGNQKKLVPFVNVVGLSVEAATAKLAEAGLNVGRVTYEESESPKGTVIYQFPEYNKTIEIAKGSLVNITVSGKESEE